MNLPFFKIALALALPIVFLASTSRATEPEVRIYSYGQNFDQEDKNKGPIERRFQNVDKRVVKNEYRRLSQGLKKIEGELMAALAKKIKLGAVIEERTPSYNSVGSLGFSYNSTFFLAPSSTEVCRGFLSIYRQAGPLLQGPDAASVELRCLDTVIGKTLPATVKFEVTDESRDRDLSQTTIKQTE